MRKKRFPVLLCAVLMCALCLAACGEKSAKEFTSLEDFNSADVAIGVSTGTVREKMAHEMFPNANIKNYSTNSDLIQNLELGKIDAYLSEDVSLAMARVSEPWMTKMPQSLGQLQRGVAFSKNSDGQALKEQFDAYLAGARADGSLDELKAHWISPDGTTDKADIDSASLTGENGTLRCAIGTDHKPYTYIMDGEPAGYEVALVVGFCRKYGYAMEISSVPQLSSIAGLAVGKYDLAVDGIAITPEHEESVLFSESIYDDNYIIVIRGSENQTGFWADLKSSFEKTFVRESRWQMFLKGIAVTVAITFMAVVGGTLFGFGLYMLCRTGSRAASAVAAVYCRIIAGTPAVVLLMVLFYVVFGRSNIDGLWVAAITFGFIFGSFVYSNLRLCVSNIDVGQTEAAYALGYTRSKTFFKIILPQAMRMFLPSYQREAASLLKSTAVVGYIAVEDLTKMSDIVRSNTYEAFFPLIATAIIYFALTWLVSYIVGRAKFRFEPLKDHRERVLKGVRL